MYNQKEAYEKLKKLKDAKVHITLNDDEKRKSIKSVDDLTQALSEIVCFMNKETNYSDNEIKKGFEAELKKITKNQNYDKLHKISIEQGNKYAPRGGLLKRTKAKYAISHAFNKLAKEYITHNKHKYLS